MNVEDIDGTKPKVRVYKFLGDKLNTEDIDGTSPKKRMERKVPHDQEFKDVYEKKSLRRENPHNP